MGARIAHISDRQHRLASERHEAALRRRACHDIVECAVDTVQAIGGKHADLVDDHHVHGRQEVEMTRALRTLEPLPHEEACAVQLESRMDCVPVDQPRRLAARCGEQHSQALAAPPLREQAYQR